MEYLPLSWPSLDEQLQVTRFPGLLYGDDICTTNDSYYFWSGQSPLSNFHHAHFMWMNIEWKNSEAAFMYAKALYFGDLATAEKIMNSDHSPSYCKALGRKVTPYNEEAWDQIRYDMMKNIVYAKFTQNPLCREFLLSLGNRDLVEASSKDTIWGIGMDVRHPAVHVREKWRGRNLLGKCLMDIRPHVLDGTPLNDTDMEIPDVSQNP